MNCDKTWIAASTYKSSMFVKDSTVIRLNQDYILNLWLFACGYRLGYQLELQCSNDVHVDYEDYVSPDLIILPELVSLNEATSMSGDVWLTSLIMVLFVNTCRLRVCLQDWLQYGLTARYLFTVYRRVQGPKSDIIIPNSLASMHRAIIDTNTDVNWSTLL